MGNRKEEIRAIVSKILDEFEDGRVFTTRSVCKLINREMYVDNAYEFTANILRVIKSRDDIEVVLKRRRRTVYRKVIKK